MRGRCLLAECFWILADANRVQERPSDACLLGGESKAVRGRAVRLAHAAPVGKQQTELVPRVRVRRRHCGCDCAIAIVVSITRGCGRWTQGTAIGIAATAAENSNTSATSECGERQPARRLGLYRTAP